MAPVCPVPCLKISVTPLQHNFQHLQMTDLRTSARDTILQTWGFPPEIFGIVENSNAPRSTPPIISTTRRLSFRARRTFAPTYSSVWRSNTTRA